MSDNKFLEELNQVVAEGWAGIKEGIFWKTVTEEGWTKELWRTVMVEVYHYVKHNSKHQAMAVQSIDHTDTKFVGWAIRHAGEELGHENMIVRDLASIGLDDFSQFEKPPLGGAAALNGYLYNVAKTYGAVARLGYSYWAENSYEHLWGLIEQAQEQLNFEEKNLTFYIEHAKIDEKHAAEVKRVVLEKAVTDEDRRQILEVARVTLLLSGEVVNDAMRDYLARTKVAA
ncbi:iron-containing redox enzyme family protein [Bacterioplanoides sp.]|uniref:iron-containing redox enzyme family protein n=1 Tax=Bacterioplanoides sp. TaxID=2066072 RepID=UPI003B59FDFF